MKNRKSVEANLTMPPDQEPTQALIAKLSPEGRRRYVDLILARDFSAFVTKVFETVSPGDVYLPNWHIDAMTCAAGCVMDGTIKRLITTVPPRHLKSIVFSVALPAFLLGRDPTNRIICVSYSSELSVKHANDFRAVMTAEWYRRVFPATKQPGEGHPVRDHDHRPRLPLCHIAARNPDGARRGPHRTGRSTKAGRGVIGSASQQCRPMVRYHPSLSPRFEVRRRGRDRHA